MNRTITAAGHLLRLGPAAMTNALGIAGSLAGGRALEGRAESGMLEPSELDDKFLRLTRGALGELGAKALFERLQWLEDEENLSWLGAPPS
jgi:hypothetical protein